MIRPSSSSSPHMKKSIVVAMSLSKLIFSQRRNQLKWLHTFLMLSLLFTATSFSSSSSWVSYSDHCASIVPESSPTVPTDSILPYLPTRILKYTGGEKILGNFSSKSLYNSWNYASLSFDPSQNIFKTNTSGVYKIHAFLLFHSSSMYYIPNNSTHGQSYYSSSPHRVNLLRFVLEGFYSRDSGKLCMVGSGSWNSKKGNPPNLDAVLKLSCPMNSTITTSLVTGKVESLSSPTDSNFFEPISILGFSTFTNYKYALVSEENGKGCSDGIDLPKNHSLGVQLMRFCSMLVGITFKLECTSLQNCTSLVQGTNYLPRVMSLNTLRCSPGDEHKAIYLIVFGNHSYMEYNTPFDPTTKLIAEGSWDGNKNRLCIVACRILNSTDGLGNAHVGDCSIRLSLRVPAFWSLRNRASIVGQIWTNKTVNESGYFNRITFQSKDYGRVGGLGVGYEYTEIERVRKSCPMKKHVKWKRERYPKGNSYDMRFDMSVKDSMGKRAWGYAVPIFVGNRSYKQYRKYQLVAKKGYHGPLNISYKISISQIRAPISAYGVSSTNLSFVRNGRVEISAEGVYDDGTGHLCMVGCRELDSKFQKSTSDAMDCEILLKLQFPPVNAKRGGVIMGGIESTRKKTDPLYFERLSISSTAFYISEAKKSIQRMDLEIVMVLVSNTLACVFVGLQLFYVKKNPDVLPFMSLAMLVILTLGHMFPLVLNFEAMFLGNRNHHKNVLFGSGGWVEGNEVVMRVVKMVAFLLEFRLLQLGWSSRLGEDSQKAWWGAEKKTLFVSLPLYLMGFLIAFLVKRHHSLWRALRSYGGLVIDGFLLPQILLNTFRISMEKSLSHSFYIGTTFVRLLPHMYDLYRACNFAREGSYLYAKPGADFYSTVWDVIILFAGVLFVVVIFLQQRFGGHCFLPQRLRKTEVYEKVPVSDG